MKKQDALFFLAAFVVFIAEVILLDTYPGTLLENVIRVMLLIELAAVVVYVVYRIVKLSRSSKKQKASRLERYGAAMSGTLKHISGLPIAEGLTVEMFYGPEKIVFVKDGQEVSVDRSKVTSIDSILGRNAAQKAMSGAATGKYVVGGNTGAAVGALASMDTQLVISYTSDGNAKSIVLDSSSSGMFPSRVVKDFKQTSTVRRSKVEL